MNERTARILGIDAARGMAMLFSCLAHFSWWLYPAYPQSSTLLSSVGMIATPTFLILSGAMTGMLCSSSTYTPLQLKYRLLNRGIFLLTFGHLLVAVAESHRDGGFVNTIAGNSIVDEIGLSMVIAALCSRFLISSNNRRYISGLAVVLFLILWWLELSLHPTSQAGRILRQALIGPDLLYPNLPSYTAPTLQYVVIFSIGLVGGGWLNNIQQDTKSYSAAVSATFLGSCLLIGFALLLFASKHVVQAFAPLWTNLIFLDRTFQISCKTPPSPAYLLFYSGCGLLITTALMAAALRPSKALHRLVNWLSVLGKASLFTFVLQYFLYWTLPDVLGIRPGKFAPAIFFSNVALLWYAARWWGSIRGNRFITVGLRAPVTG